MKESNKLVLIGFGNTASYLSKEASSYDIKYATTRSQSKFERIEASNLEPILIHENKFGELSEITKDADVLVSFPPDGESDLHIAEAIANSRRLIYISSTSVYGDQEGKITYKTELDRNCSYAQKRIEAEEIWQKYCNAVVLRAPALYCPEYGLHKSLLDGKFRLPGDGTRYSSRIHLTDLGRIIRKVFELDSIEGSFVVGDLCPSTQIEVVTWLCNKLNLELPLSKPLEEAHYTQRSNRQIDPGHILDLLDYSLLYPTYKEGFNNCINGVS